MAARSCGPCVTNWPTDNSFMECPICGEKTSYRHDRSPDFTQSEAKEHIQEHGLRMALAEAARRSASPEHQNRVDRYLVLGFSEVDAQVLALAKRTHVDSRGRRWVRPVNHLDVAKMLEAGCSRALVLEIFS